MKILGPSVLSVVLSIAFIIFLYRYWIFLDTLSIRYRILLFSLRAVTVMSLLLLFINPWLSFSQKIDAPQKIDVIFDHSESLKTHYKKANLQSQNILNHIEEWGNSNQIHLNIYRLGANIKQMRNLDFFDPSTNFSQLGQFLTYENPDQLLLITDGKATVGRDLIHLDLPVGIPMHVLGVGPEKEYSDLKIKNINFPYKFTDTDTINMIVKLESSLEKRYKTNLHIQNNHFEIIYDSTIQFESGNQINEIFISIDSEKFSGVNKMTVVPLNDEEKVDNNHYEFRVNNISSNDVILLISGSLSPNTSIIKSILRKIDKAEVKHSFRLDAMHWNELPSDLLNSTPRMIVLDDFPLVKNDQLMMNQIISDAKKIQSQIVYLEGPNSNLSTAEMIRLHFPILIPLAIDSNNPTELSDKSMSLGAFGVDISDFPPQYRSVKWTTINKSWISYTDNSFMLATVDNLFMLSVPDIMACHLKTNQNNSSAMRQLIRNMFLHAFYRNDGFLDLHINKNSFNIGDNINASIQAVEQLELKNLLLSVIHVGSDTVKIDCSKEILSNDYKCNHILQKAGEYIFIAEAMLANEEQVVSNSIEVVVQNINIEHKDLTQEKYILTLIAHKTKGHYLPIESLDSMLTLIDITPVQLIKNYQLSGLSTQYYWWFLILLLGVEWYYRKKLGFL